jgi:hypothetical protein
MAVGFYSKPLRDNIFDMTPVKKVCATEHAQGSVCRRVFNWCIFSVRYCSDLCLFKALSLKKETDLGNGIINETD